MAQNKDENQELKDPEINQNEEKEIDLLELFYKLWSKKKLILIWCIWGAIAGLIIAFSIPREYSTTVKLAPEVRSRNRTLTGNLSALASLAGISTSGNSNSDAMYPQLYPDIVGSVPFLTSLFDVPVKDKKGNEYTVREYITQETKRPWWSSVMGLPGKAVGTVTGLFRNKESEGKEENHVLNTFQLTNEEMGLVGALRGRINANVDQKTYVITISSRMQDPVVSAILADTVVSRLRDYITEYRTDKSRQDLEYALKINEEAQQEYYQAQQRLADYTDRNQNLATQSARVNRERLQNEASLAFNLYNETALQVQNARSKVQETTPVYMELSPATVPLRPTSPRKGLILGGCIFLAFAACCAWILFGKPVLNEYKLKAQTLKEEEAKQKEIKEEDNKKENQ